MTNYSSKKTAEKTLFVLRVEKTVHMHYKIAHMGVVYRLLRLGFPGAERGRVVWKDAYDVKRVQIAKLHVLKIVEFAAKYEVKELFLVIRLRHVLSSLLSS